MKPFKNVCRCGDNKTWHYSSRGECMISKWYSTHTVVPCPCKEYIPSDNLEYLEMKACE